MGFSSQNSEVEIHTPYITEVEKHCMLQSSLCVCLHSNQLVSWVLEKRDNTRYSCRLPMCQKLLWQSCSLPLSGSNWIQVCSRDVWNQSNPKLNAVFPNQTITDSQKHHRWLPNHSWNSLFHEKVFALLSDIRILAYLCSQTVSEACIAPAELW